MLVFVRCLHRYLACRRVLQFNCLSYHIKSLFLFDLLLLLAQSVIFDLMRNHRLRIVIVRLVVVVQDQWRHCLPSFCLLPARRFRIALEVAIQFVSYYLHAFLGYM